MTQRHAGGALREAAASRVEVRWRVEVARIGESVAGDEDELRGVRGEEGSRAHVADRAPLRRGPVLAAKQDGMASLTRIRRGGQSRATAPCGEHRVYRIRADHRLVDEEDERRVDRYGLRIIEL